MPSNTFFPNDGGCRPTIDRWHHEVHEGCLFGWHYENFSLASSGTVYIRIKTGAKSVHTQVEFATLGGILQTQWYGAPTIGTAGTAIPCINRNRNYYLTNTSLTTIDVGPTVTTVGTVLFGARAALGSTAGQAKVTTNIAGDAERVLKPNTDYLIKLTAIGAISCTADGLFYEEDV